jgi:hypothetical protein
VDVLGVEVEDAVVGGISVPSGGDHSSTTLSRTLTDLRSKPPPSLYNNNKQTKPNRRRVTPTTSLVGQAAAVVTSTTNALLVGQA